MGYITIFFQYFVIVFIAFLAGVNLKEGHYIWMWIDLLLAVFNAALGITNQILLERLNQLRKTLLELREKDNG